MTDYSEHGAIPVDDAAVPNPPTVDEVLERQRAQQEDAAEQDDAADPSGDDDA